MCIRDRTGADGTTNAPTSYSKVLTGKATGYYSRTGKGSSGPVSYTHLDVYKRQLSMGSMGLPQALST